MQPLRNVLRGNTAAGSSRTALNAVSTRVSEATGLEAETWVAADVEDSGSPMFSEPLTIDELNAARQHFENTCAGPADSNICHDDSESVVSSEGTTSSSVISLDANQQMQQIHSNSMRSHQSVSEFLDAALLAARDTSVQHAVISALFNSPDAMAALQRGLAHEGIGMNAQRIQRLALLPPSAALAVADRQTNSETFQDYEVACTGQAEISVSESFSLKHTFDAMRDEVLRTLAKLGGNVRTVLEGLGKRWRRRIERLFNIGAQAKYNRHGTATDAAHEDHMLVDIVDGIVSAAALIITIAMLKRIPLLR